MSIKTKIFKPKSKLNELESNYKIVAWKNGIQSGIKFRETKKQALEEERRFKKMLKK